MTLESFHFKPDYNKAFDNIANDFYIPCIENSIGYDRITGYFASTIYIIAWNGIKTFIKNNGKMRIICSPYIVDEDKAAITEGYHSKSEDQLRITLEIEIKALLQNNYLSKPYRALACFISNGNLEIKFVIDPHPSNPEINRLFHDKVGIFSDLNGNKVGFRGSMNETYKGLSSDGNLESIDVFPDWLDERDKNRVDRAVKYFEELWNNSVDGVSVIEFPEIPKNLLTEYAKHDKWEALVEEIRIESCHVNNWLAENGVNRRYPKSHQLDALETWKLNDYHGILEHATGSGKTFTALCAIRHLLEKGFTPLVVVPSVELLNQWCLEMKQVFGDDPSIHIYPCGDKYDLWKNDGNLFAWSSKNIESSVIIISTIDTAATDMFISSLNQGEHLFLVADEVHRLGSHVRRKVLTIKKGAALGLSATPQRFGDPEGTSKIFEYFKGLIPPPFTLKDAIEKGVLSRYFYYPHEVALEPEEQLRWDILTKKIKSIIARMKSKDVEFSDLLKVNKLKFLFFQRSHIVKNAYGKVRVAKKIIEENFERGQRWLIYCDNQDQLNKVMESIRSIGFDSFEYHSNMIGDRSSTLRFFSLNGGIVVSIKCLDEGVDIPEADHALILASSKNPREFIQRRGRILRKSDGKDFAFLYDTIVTPSSEEEGILKNNSILEGELARAIQFGEWAMNPSCITNLKNIAIKYGVNIDVASNEGDEDE